MNFAYESQTEAHGSCAATLGGEMFVLGGLNQEQQVNIKNVQTTGYFFVRIITELEAIFLDKQSSRLQTEKGW